MPISLKTREIKDDITVTQDVNLDTMESDTVSNNAHRVTISGNPHSVLASEVSVADSGGYFTATNVEDVDSELHELKEPKYLEYPLSQSINAGEMIGFTDDAGTSKFTKAVGIGDPQFGVQSDSGFSWTQDVGADVCFASKPGTDVVCIVYNTGNQSCRGGRINSDGTITWGTETSLGQPYTGYYSGQRRYMVYHPEYDRFFLFFAYNGTYYARIMSIDVDDATLTVTPGTARNVGSGSEYLRSGNIYYAGTDHIAIAFGRGTIQYDLVLLDWDSGTDTYGESSRIVLGSNSWANYYGYFYWDDTTDKGLWVAEMDLDINTSTRSYATMVDLQGYNRGVNNGTLVAVDGPTYVGRTSMYAYGGAREPNISAGLAAGHDAIGVFMSGLNTQVYGYMFDVNWASNSWSYITYLQGLIGDPTYGLRTPGGSAFWDSVNEHFVLVGRDDTYETTISIFTHNGTTYNTGSTYIDYDDQRIGGWGGNATIVNDETVTGTYLGLWVYQIAGGTNTFAFDPGPATSDLSAVCGVAQESGSVGSIIKAVGMGGISTVHTGLTPGEDYYVQPDSPFVGTTPTQMYLGKAISDTEIKIMPKKNSVIISTDGTLTAEDDYEIYVDTTASPSSVILPSSPSFGDKLKIIDTAGQLSVNNLTIDSNGLNIRGSVQNITVDLDWMIIELFYTGASNGWNFRVHV